MKTSENKPYPNFTKDLYNKNTIIYETFEKKNGIHKNIEGCQFFWCGKEDDKDEFINTLKNIGYNCDNIINVIN